MHTVSRRTIRDQADAQSDAARKGGAQKGGTQKAAARKEVARFNECLPDGVGGTITGGAMQPINLIEILRLGGRGASRGGAVSGAAQGAVYGEGRSAGRTGGRRDAGIALSDGSRIIFASVEEAAVPDERFLAVSET